MTSEEHKGVVEFVRKYVKLIADFAVLNAILQDCERRQKPPMGWQKTWTELQQDEPYTSVVQFFEPLLVAVERARSETELIALIHKIALTPPTN